MLREPIGRGGMGEVWRATDPVRGQDVAVKVLTPQAARDPVFLEAFRTEVRAVAQLDHPSIIRVHDHGRLPGGIEGLSAGCPYLVMELAPGGSLNRHRGHLAWPALRDCLLALLGALAHAHARGVIHRDLKPGNVLLGSRSPRDPRLCDFGLAHALDRQLPESSDELVMGTPAYMPPEQIDGQWRDFGPWTDLYALGCTAWALAASTPPFGKITGPRLYVAQLSHEPPAFVPREPMPTALEPWLRRLMRKSPGDRYRDAAEAARGLLEIDDDRTDADSRRRPPVPHFLRPQAGPREARPGREIEPPGAGLFALRPLPMIGRTRERSRLWEALEGVRDGGGTRVCLLRGPSGVGTTRLARWLAEAAQESGTATALQALHGPIGGPHDGLAPMLARHLKCIGLAPAAVADRLGAQFPPRDASEEADGAALLALLRASPEEGKPTGAAERFALVRRLLVRLSHDRPVVLTLDDAHDGLESLEFVRWVLDGSGGPPPPLLVLVTLRDEALPDRPEASAILAELAGRSTVVSLEVGPLGTEHRSRLVRGMLGLDPALAGEVERRTEGNPLFAVQWVSDWLARGLLQRGPNGLQLRADAQVEPPRDLREQWTARVDWLLEVAPPAAARGLELAAVLGQEVDARDWEEACAAAGATASADLVDALMDSRLARSLPGDGWSFTHAMLRECLVLRAEAAGRLREAHAACVQMLRQRTGRDVRERLGRHLVGAGDWSEAVEALLDGVQRRVDTGDYGLARSLLAERDRALEALALPPDDVRLGESAVSRTQLLRLTGRIEEAGARAAEIAAVADDVGTPWDHVRALASRECGRAARWRGDRAEAERWFSAAEAAATASGDRWLLALTLHDRANLLLSLGRLSEAHRAFQAAIALQKTTGDVEGMGGSFLGLAEFARRRGNLDEAVEAIQEARRLFDAGGVRWGRAMGANILAEVRRAQGDLEAAEEGYREALEIFVAIGATHAIFPEINLSVVLIERGRYAEARQCLEATLGSLKRRHMEDLAGELHCCLLPCVAAEGDWTAWDRHASTGIELLKATGSVDPDTAMVTGLAARLAAAAGQTERARAAYSLAIGQLRALGRDADEAAMLEAKLALGSPSASSPSRRPRDRPEPTG